MTYRQAVAEAQRRLGIPEDAIQWSSGKVPNSNLDEQIKLPAGATEDDLIKHLEGEVLRLYGAHKSRNN
jgi:hypothetical protein